MSRGLKIAVAVVLAGALGFPAYAGYDLWTTSSQLASSQREVESARSTAKGWEATESAAQDQLKEVEDRSKKLAGASSARLDFNSKLEAAKEQLQLASGKIDSSAQQKRIVAAQNAVIENYSDRELIEAQAAELTAVADELKALLADFDQKAKAPQKAAPRAQTATGSVAPTAASPAPQSPGVDWLSDLRSRLDAVGGAGVPLSEFDGNCTGTARALACSYPAGNIVVRRDLGYASAAKKNAVMAHELAHQYQFKVWDALYSSPGYAALFGSNPETLANCMATAKGYTGHGMSCSPDQVSWASSIWSGVVPS